MVAGLALDVPDGFSHVRRDRRLGGLAGVLGYSLLLRPLIVLAVGVGGGLVAPAWFAWLGLVLRRGAPAS